ncbi:MAG TPA: sodium:glutamate symporter [Candidatus Ornithospirochaeta avicola]|uniref:Sodium:glutamate symporter n=1 Tax=Candidatus Ornithospirochaeta avicola TaxID=2840896 RepID=A0A9D1PSQ3_9SPIO|nr:sodium:glutamate symporter [Candidatus Ornithospirochaeta avicola]
MDFSYIIHFGIISAALLLGAFLRSRIRFLQKYLIPSSIIGGFMLLFFYNYAAPHLNLNSDFLGDLVYHLLNISFIAMMLRTPEEKKVRKSRVIGETVVSTVAQYGLQCTFGLIVAIILIFTVMPDLSPAIGLSLPLGFELGPGQAYSMSLPWEAMGFEGATSVGLAMAAIGFVVGSIGGVILINIGIRKGWVDESLRDKINRGETRSGFLKKEHQREGSRITTDGESLDTLSYHIALIMVTYLISWALLSFISYLLSFIGAMGVQLADSLWGVNFIFSVFCASFVRAIMTKAGISYTIDNHTLNRVNGLSVDLTVTSCLGAISLTAISSYWLPITLLSVIGILITMFLTPYYCARLYDDHKFERTLVLIGTATGTLPTGLSLLRVVDPDFETPAATDYVYASSIVFFLVIPLILLINLPQLSVSGGSGYLLYIMLSVTALYTILCTVAYFLYAGKRARIKKRVFFLTDNE